MNHDITIEKETGPLTIRQDEASPGQQNLSIAAESAAKAGVNLQDFMSAAYGAYLAANPELREQMESQYLMAQLDELRRHGRLGQA